MKDCIEIELKKICILTANTMPNRPNLFSVDEAIDMYNQIQEELLLDNEIEEFMKYIQNDDRLALEQTSKSSNVCCPVCQKSSLVEIDHSFIMCNSNKCNFKVDINKSGLNMSLLCSRLENIINQHTCAEIPCFQFKNATDFNNNDTIMLNQFVGNKPVSFYLLASCESCNFFDVIV